MLQNLGSAVKEINDDGGEVILENHTSNKNSTDPPKQVDLELLDMLRINLRTKIDTK